MDYKSTTVEDNPPPRNVDLMSGLSAIPIIGGERVKIFYRRNKNENKVKDSYRVRSYSERDSCMSKINENILV